MTAYARAAYAQAIAADPAQSAFVTANAGSGKTKVLIDRIVRLLLAGAQPSAFLCITYTKAAAAEMQRRLFERLGAWCVAPDEDLRRELTDLQGGALRAEDLARARALFARALESPGGLKIQTIHAFCERLLARFPLEAGAPPGFEIADDAAMRALMGEALDEIVGEPEALAALRRFAARLPRDRFDQLLATLGRENASKKAPIAQGDDADALMRAYLADVDAAELTRAAAALEESGANDKKLATRVRAALAPHAAPRAAFEAHCAIFLKDDGTVRRDAPTKSMRTAHAWLDLMFSPAGAQGAALRAREAVKTAERAADAAALALVSRAYARALAEAKARTGALDFSDLIAKAHALLTKADAAAWVLYKLDGGVDHILIDEGQDTSPLQWALIAPLQAEFFAGAGARGHRTHAIGPLPGRKTAHTFPGSGLVRTMFAVGDPKQSIYSFQGADPAQFLNELRALEARVIGAGRAFVAPRLDMSFRSAPEILRLVDRTFAGAELGGDIPGVFDELSHDARREREEGRVEWWPLAQKAETPPASPWDAPLDMDEGTSAQARLANALAARAADWIAKGEGVWEGGALRPMHAGDILILVRTRGGLFRQLLKAFKRAGLPVAGADRMVLREEAAVEDCLALLRVARDPGDDLSLACLLKSPWIGLVDDDRDLFPLAHGRCEASLFSRLFAVSDPCYEPAREFIRELMERAHHAPERVLTWALERADGEGRSGWERLFARLGPDARDPLEEVLARAGEAHRHGPDTIAAFIAAIEGDDAEVKREMESAGRAVRIMTVHGAKGLEAPVVILPDTVAGHKPRGEPDMFMTPAGALFSASSADDDARCAAARAAWGERAWGEYLRLLYVALTRARDRLVVCGAADGRYGDGAHERAWHRMVGAAMESLGQEIETPFGPGLGFGAARIAPARDAAGEARCVLPDWARAPVHAPKSAAPAAPSRLRKEAPALSPRAEGETRFRRGLLIHGLLQRLPDVAPKRRRAAAHDWLTRQGAGAGEITPLTDETLRVIEAPAFARAFGPSSRAETPIIGRVAGRAIRGIVDRLVVTDDEVEIIDFKSDRPSPPAAADAPDAYVLQMALYRAVLKEIFPTRNVRCGLIWTERPLLVELPAAQMEAELAALIAG